MNPELYTGQHGTYFVHPQALARVSFAPSDIARISPVMVLPSPEKGRSFDRQHVLDVVERFRQNDDVFSADFLTNIMIMQDTVVASKRSLWDGLQTCLGEWNVTRSLCLCDGAPLLPPGPYFLQGGCLHQAWRCYADEQDAFSVALYPGEVLSAEFSLKPLTFLEPQGIHRFVAVPSRLYHTRSTSRPLAGERITVRDNFSLTGLTGANSAGAYDAEFERVQRLQALGAVIIGKIKASALVPNKEQNDYWAGFHSHRKARADTLQTPPGSSDGMNMSVSGYKWLDDTEILRVS